MALCQVRLLNDVNLKSINKVQNMRALLAMWGSTPRRSCAVDEFLGHSGELVRRLPSSLLTSCHVEPSPRPDQDEPLDRATSSGSASLYCATAPEERRW